MDKNGTSLGQKYYGRLLKKIETLMVEGKISGDESSQINTLLIQMRQADLNSATFYAQKTLQDLQSPKIPDSKDVKNVQELQEMRLVEEIIERLPRKNTF